LPQYLARGQKKRRRIKGRKVHTERIKYRVSMGLLKVWFSP
jgi:hypothetical protein